MVARPGLPSPVRALCLAVLAAIGAPAFGQATETKDDAVVMESVVVKGQLLRGTQLPFSSTAFSTDEIREQDVSQPQEMFKWVPGMNVRSLGLGAVADNIVLRGFGGGGHGGDIGMVIDGIPLNEAMSHADGYADLNVVIPLEIDQMTIFRGPVSPLYGNFNRAGLIVIDTRKSGAYRQGDFSIGSDTTGDAQVAMGARLADNQQLNLAAQYYTTDGFRPQSDTWRATLAGRWAIDVTPALQIALSTRLHKGEGDSASYLTQAQYDVDPYGIDPRVQNDGAEKTFGTLRADVNYLINPELKLLTFVYGTAQDFTRWFTRPVSTDPTANWRQREETYDRRVFGAGANLNGHTHLSAGPLNWVAGIETFRESTDYQYYDGLNRRVRVNPAIFDRESTLNSASAFGEVEAVVHPLFKPTLGLRYDRFTGECTRNGPETGGDPCGSMNSMDNLSPKVGVRSDVLPQLQLRASWSEGFALPSDFVKYAIGASNLDPNIFRQTEVGGTARLLDQVTADVALYRIDSSNEIRTVAPGVYENYGDTRREGVEVSLNWTPIDDVLVNLVWAGTTSEVEANGNAALVGKEVAGVPDQTGAFGVTWAPAYGWGGTATVRYVGSYYVDPANTMTSDAYTTVDLSLSYGGRFDSVRYRAYARVDNVLDETYATSVSLIGGQAVYAPGSPRVFSVGIQLDW